MALVDNRVCQLWADDGTSSDFTITADDVTGAIDHVTVVNNTPLPAVFTATWKGNTFTTTVPAHTTRTWTPPNQMKNQANWQLDQIPFRMALG